MSLPPKHAPTLEPSQTPKVIDEEGLVVGMPGYRTRSGRSGLDYIDTNAEWSHMQGVLIRGLITFKLRTGNPFYLCLMLIAGLVLLLPIIFLMGDLLFSNHLDFIFLIFALPITFFGIAFLANFTFSLIERPRG